MEAIDFTGPEHQAKHLARYISCPSTIRAHCVNDWGRAPDLDRIKGWQAGFRRVSKTVAEPKDGDDLMPRLGSIKAAPCKPRPHPRPTTFPWPKWYSPPTTAFVASDLIASVARAFGLTGADITGPARGNEFIHARAVAVRILRDRGWSHPRIGRVLGGRDHSTIINMARNFEIYERRNEQVTAVYRAHRAAGWCGNAA